jgi:hypothetical protein
VSFTHLIKKEDPVWARKPSGTSNGRYASVLEISKKTEMLRKRI